MPTSIEKNIAINTQHAAKTMAGKLSEYKNSGAVVLAVPKGGVPIAYQVSQLLQLPIEFVLCKRIPHPGMHDKSIGSVSIDETIINEKTQRIPQDYICHQIILIKNALKNQFRFYCGDHKPISLKNKVVIVVDDFLKSGDTLLACLKSIRNQKPSKVVVALAIASHYGARQIAPYSDEMIILTTVDDPVMLEDIQRNLPTVTENEVRNIFTKAQINN